MVVQGRGEYVGVELSEDWSCFDIIETGDGYLEGFFCMCLEFSVMKVKEKKAQNFGQISLAQSWRDESFPAVLWTYQAGCGWWRGLEAGVGTNQAEKGLRELE